MMKKHFLWASLLLSLTFTQQSEAAFNALTDLGDLTTNMGAIRKRIGSATGTLVADINTLSTTFGLLATDEDAGLSAHATTVLGEINTQLGLKGSTGAGGLASLDAVASDIATITTSGISRTVAEAGLGENVTTVFGTAEADFNTAVGLVQDSITTATGASIAADIATVGATIITAETGVLSTDLLTLSDLIVETPLADRQLEVAQISGRLLTTPGIKSLEVCLNDIDALLGGDTGTSIEIRIQTLLDLFDPEVVF